MSGALVQIATAYSVGEAMIVQSMLRAYGVHANSFDTGVAAVDPGLMIAIGGIRIMVPQDDAELASELLWTDVVEGTPPRPYSPNPWTNAFWLLTLGLMGVPPIARVPLQRSV